MWVPSSPLRFKNRVFFLSRRDHVWNQRTDPKLTGWSRSKRKRSSCHVIGNDMRDPHTRARITERGEEKTTYAACLVKFKSGSFVYVDPGDEETWQSAYPPSGTWNTMAQKVSYWITYLLEKKKVIRMENAIELHKYSVQFTRYIAFHLYTLHTSRVIHFVARTVTSVFRISWLKD